MALIKCPECGKEYSDTAKSCPNCGYIEKRTPKIQRWTTGGNIQKAIVFIAVVAILAGVVR